MGAAKVVQLTVTQIDAAGASSVVAIAATGVGARNPVVDKDSNAYLADPTHGGILVVSGNPQSVQKKRRGPQKREKEGSSSRNAT